jgi:guanine deaminase
MCLAAIYWAHCDAIFYGNTAADAAATGFDDGMLYEEMTRPHAARRTPISMLLRDEALSSFAAWKASPLRIDY